MCDRSRDWPLTLLPDLPDRQATGAEVWGQAGGRGLEGLPASLVDMVAGLLNPLTKSGLSLILRLSLSSASPSPPGK